jgi:hypothetical protein
MLNGLRRSVNERRQAHRVRVLSSSKNPEKT